ncbi:hypothetical protein DUNSADRAFT_4306 [Dunaliella salina]|uniref:Secreted protein n=1 Tax=Dunaliella salina TaxID=3046 RepID=A0ABQ7H7M1_DUNSA|nr:hypothetical protein DUNSADRAFT_4306 [Dunaliella salina]|eukprot:KAF5842847.1 hypothetical protein DUNSADRAFT_4306 [Dunaliella salina]
MPSRCTSCNRGSAWSGRRSGSLILGMCWLSCGQVSSLLPKRLSVCRALCGCLLSWQHVAGLCDLLLSRVLYRGLLCATSHFTGHGNLFVSMTSEVEGLLPGLTFLTLP